MLGVDTAYRPPVTAVQPAMTTLPQITDSPQTLTLPSSRVEWFTSVTERNGIGQKSMSHPSHGTESGAQHYMCFIVMQS
jgi:hypothetical protein